MLKAVLLEAPVGLLDDRLEPNRLTLLRRCNRYICEGTIRCCTVPMLHTRSALDQVSFVNNLDWLPSFLVKAEAFGDEQNLATWVNVPVQHRTGIIGSHGNAGIKGA